MFTTLISEVIFQLGIALIMVFVTLLSSTTQPNFRSEAATVIFYGFRLAIAIVSLILGLMIFYDTFNLTLVESWEQKYGEGVIYYALAHMTLMFSLFLPTFFPIGVLVIQDLIHDWKYIKHTQALIKTNNRTDT